MEGNICLLLAHLFYCNTLNCHQPIRTVLFGEQIKKLGLQDEQIFSLEEFNKVKNSLLGMEKYFAGQIRLNAFSNTNEFSIQEISDVNPEELIKMLEEKV